MGNGINYVAPITNSKFQETVFQRAFHAVGENIADASVMIDNQHKYVNQESGKTIQSVDKQDILREWLLRGVFQLSEHEVLTGKKLESLEINGIRLSKFKTGEIGVEFIWIDLDNPL